MTSEQMVAQDEGTQEVRKLWAVVEDALGRQHHEELHKAIDNLLELPYAWLFRGLSENEQAIIKILRERWF